MPSAILDAHALQENIGDGFLGPSDHVFFRHIQVAPEDVAKWTSRLSVISEPVTYAAPEKMQNWWVLSQAFPHLAFYQAASPISGSAHGWIGVSPSDGHIFVFGYTM